MNNLTSDYKQCLVFFKRSGVYILYGLISSIFLTPTWAQLDIVKSEIYTGTLAGQDIVLLIDRHPITGLSPSKYFYRRLGQIIYLDNSGLGYWQEFTDPNYGEPTGIWKVTVASGSVRGVWKKDINSTSEKKVSLVLADSPGDANPIVFNEMRLADHMQSIGAESKNGVAWEVMRDNISGMKLIRLKQSPYPATMNRINDELKKQFYGSVETESDGETQAVLFVNHRVISIGFEFIMTGGAHPSNAFSSLSFDLKTGEVINWNHFFRPGDLTPGALNLNRQDVIAGPVLRAVAISNDECMTSVAAHYKCDSSTCNDFDAKEVKGWTMYPSKEGLSIAIDIYSEAERGCRGTTVTVPWENLHQSIWKDRELLQALIDG
jgi:hypothetical protein